MCDRNETLMESLERNHLKLFLVVVFADSVGRLPKTIPIRWLPRRGGTLGYVLCYVSHDTYQLI
ncbi:hypothetical protein STEG23_023930, partial [Scotinomys teguina]